MNKKTCTQIVVFISLIILIILTGCKSKQEKTVTAEQKELKVWAIPNVPEGAEAYFSPDGKRMICNAKMEGDEAFFVYTLNIDGTDIKQINDRGEDACSYYHPDGKSLIWTSTRDNLDLENKGNYSKPEDYPKGAELYTSDLDGNNVKRLTTNNNYDAEVTYSPDGKKILFGRMIDGKMDLWLMLPDGSNQHQITHTPEWQEGGAFFMPDNETIICRAWKRSDQGQRGLPMAIFTFKDDGTDRKQITDAETTNWAPFPALDSKHFVFVKVLPPHNYEIFLMNMETGKQQQLTFNKAFDGFPAISPDSKTLSFSSSRGAKPGERKLSLFLMDISSLDLN